MYDYGQLCMSMGNSGSLWIIMYDYGQLCMTMDNYG